MHVLNSCLSVLLTVQQRECCIVQCARKQCHVHGGYHNGLQDVVLAATSSSVDFIHLLAEWQCVHGEVTIKANHWMVTENIIDMAHVPYVHSGTVGNHAGVHCSAVYEL